MGLPPSQFTICFLPRDFLTGPEDVPFQMSLMYSMCVFSKMTFYSFRLGPLLIRYLLLPLCVNCVLQ